MSQRLTSQYNSVIIYSVHHFAKMNITTSNDIDPDKDIPDLSGKVCIHLKRSTLVHVARSLTNHFQIFVVTGGSAGIGYGVVAHLLQHNASAIHLLSNKEEHAES